jgi:integrase
MLTEPKIKRLRTEFKERLQIDIPGSGLYLRIPKSASPSLVKSAAWVIRTKRKGKATRRKIGSWPAMSLAAARKRREEIMCADDGLTTVSSTILEYSKYEGDKRKSSDQAARYLKNIKEAFGQRIISTITRAELVDEIRMCSADRGERTAAIMLSQYRVLFRFALESGYIENNPLDGVTKKITGYQYKPRQRILSPDEIREMWQWDEPVLKFLLLTGLRINEALRGHQDGERWIIPAEISKNKKSHWVHLPTVALGLTCPDGFRTTDQRVQLLLREKQAEYEDTFTPHDLRRTVSTLLNEAGCAPHIVDKMLNHSISGIAGVYNRAEYEHPRIDAAIALEAAVISIITKD